MSRASTLARAIGADGTLNVADVAGLAAVASSGSASDLTTGTLSNARLASGAAVANLGYTPVNRAGDTMSGALNMGGNNVNLATNKALTNDAWAGTGGYPGYYFSGSGNSRFGFAATGGVIDVYADGDFYANEGANKVLNAGNYGSYAVPLSGGTMTGRLIAGAGASISGTVVTSSGGTYCPSTGVFILNLESNFGLYTSGLLIVTGNENGVNQTIRTYSWNLSHYGYSSNTRYVRLKAIDTNQLNNGYGDVYAYIGANAASYTSLDQSASGTATSTSDIYLRNAVGQGCSISYTIWRT